MHTHKCILLTQIDSQTAYGYYNRGIAYDKLQRYQEAITDFDVAVNLYKDKVIYTKTCKNMKYKNTY